MKTMLDIDFHAADLPGGADAILGPSGCEKDVVKIQDYTVNDVRSILVKITLDETDPRVAKVLALLDDYGKQRWVDRWDVYTEDELQRAPLVRLNLWWDPTVLAVTTYDESNACPKCKTGARQTSALHTAYSEIKGVEKLRVAGTTDNDVLVYDVDVERLLAAGVTGALFWPIYAKNKAGDDEETRRQQVFIDHVMPPMSAKSLLDRSQVCSDCGRGWFTHFVNYPFRVVYRREDLTNIQDFNLTWEWFGEHRPVNEHGLGGGAHSPIVLVTPKVMNLLRGKTKKEQKYQGCGFAPIWIEDDTHDKPYLMT